MRATNESLLCHILKKYGAYQELHLLSMDNEVMNFLKDCNLLEDDFVRGQTNLYARYKISVIFKNAWINYAYHILQLHHLTNDFVTRTIALASSDIIMPFLQILQNKPLKHLMTAQDIIKYYFIEYAFKRKMIINNETMLQLWYGELNIFDAIFPWIQPTSCWAICLSEFNHILEWRFFDIIKWSIFNNYSHGK